LREQEFIVLAGSPSSGKTSLALNIAVNAALRSDTKSAVISLETSGIKVVHRLNCIVSGASGQNLLNGTPTEGDLLKMSRKSKDMRIVGERVSIYDKSGLTPRQCLSVMRQAYADGARLFIVDYLQLLDAGQNTKGSYEKASYLSKAMKMAAKELNSPIICVASLNRASAREGREPNMSDLRDSGQIEYDADKIILLHALDNAEDARTVQAHVAKNKDGMTGKATLSFLPECMQFRNAIIDYEEPKPTNNHKKPYAD
jgi:replicative DNA helicase